MILNLPMVLQKRIYNYFIGIRLRYIVDSCLQNLNTLKIQTSQKLISYKEELNSFHSAQTSLHFNCFNVVDCLWYSQTINCLLFLISIITGSKTNVWNVVVQSHWETSYLWILKKYWFKYWLKKVSKSLCQSILLIHTVIYFSHPRQMS